MHHGVAGSHTAFALLQLLAEAAQLLPILTSAEHEEIVRLASILLLGFLLPYSTGNESLLLQGAQRGPDFDPTRHVLHMDLEERLEQSTKVCNAGEYGEVDTLTDPRVELALRLFLKHGLRPLLRGRAFPRSSVDVLHLIAMVIHPRPRATDMLPHTSRSFHKSRYWTLAQRLMQSPAALQFAIDYGIRRELVDLVAEDLCLPPLDDESSEVVGPLLHGALAHLRASLRAFAQETARSLRDAHTARAALVAVTTQVQNRRMIDEEWEFMLHTMVQDHSDYHCQVCFGGGGGRGGFCAHSARGRLLAEIIVRCCRSRKVVDQSLLQRFLSSLTDAVEWQADCWTKDEDEDEKKQKFAPCLLASLLHAAAALFPLLPPAGDEEEDNPSVTLIESSLQLLRHPDTGVAGMAADLLVAALSRRSIDAHAPMLFETCKRILRDEDKDCLFLERVVALASQGSLPFASSMLQILVDSMPQAAKQVPLCKLVAAIASNAPRVAIKIAERLAEMIGKCNESDAKLHLAAAILSTRRARMFAGEPTKSESLALEVIDSQAHGWRQYQMARHSIVVGHYDSAAKLYRHLLHHANLSEQHYLWISSLEQISSAEACLVKDGAKGIPMASVRLRSGLTLLQSIGVFGVLDETLSYEFQIRFLLLRLDFLDLATVLRQLTREMRLTGSGPQKNTRSIVHLQNCIKGLIALSSRIRDLIQRNGASFERDQSNSVLKLLQGVSLFFARAARRAFVDVLPPAFEKVSIKSILRTSADPLARFMERLDELVVKPMDATVEPIVRAAAMLEIIDGILMAPIPFPKDFFAPKPRMTASLTIATDPEERLDLGVMTFDAIDAYPSIDMVFTCNGSVPVKLLQSRRPSWTLLLWYKLVYEGPIDEDEADDKTNDDEAAVPSREIITSRMPDLSSFSPVSAPLHKNGTFLFSVECPPILDEGLFTLHVRLGCMDVEGNQWELPLPAEARSVPVRVARSRL